MSNCVKVENLKPLQDPDNVNSCDGGVPTANISPIFQELPFQAVCQT